LVCDSCPKLYKWEVDLIRHIQSNHQGLIFKCGACGKEFLFMRRQFHCDFCDHQASAPSALLIHVQAIHEGRRYPCEKCDNKFTGKGDLTRHKNSVHGIKRNSNCDQCSVTIAAYYRKDLLKYHSSSVHGNGGMYQCGYCEHRATTENCLIKHHLAVHEEDTRYSCDKCELVTKKTASVIHVVFQPCLKEPTKSSVLIKMLAIPGPE